MLKRSWKTLLGCVGGALLFAAPVSAVTFVLDTEFDDAVAGSYATVQITENAGDLDFSIALDASLGPDRDLHEFYFNLIGTFTGVQVSSLDPQSGSAYSLSAPPTVAGGAGASFDYGMNFGNGGGSKGNGKLQAATFTISANEALALADLFELSTAAGGSVLVHFAAHVQDTALAGTGADSETVGGVIPEPATALLLAIGIAGLGAAGRRRERTGAERR